MPIIAGSPDGLKTPPEKGTGEYTKEIAVLGIDNHVTTLMAHFRLAIISA